MVEKEEALGFVSCQFGAEVQRDVEVERQGATLLGDRFSERSSWHPYWHAAVSEGE